VEIDGAQRAGALRGKQVPLLLAYMLLNRSRHIGREELIGALWPDDAPVSQDAALRTLLSRLRSALGTASLAGRDELILELPAPVWIDLEAAALEVERARGALARGDARSAWAIAQVPLNIAGRGLLPGAQANWLDARRRELEDVRLQALEVVGRAGLTLGGSQLASVERAARSLIESEPYRESGYVLLMEAFAGQGNVAEGLRVFETLRTLLREELGTSPSPETIAAHERLLRPASRGQVTERADGSGAARYRIELPAELTVRAEAPLVGRKRELEQLWSLWAAATEPGAGADRGRLRGPPRRLVMMTGDPGIGKSRLAAEIARRAHDEGAFVLAGRSPQEALVPYQPFVEALRQYFMGVPFSELRASAREYGSELARLVPELRRRAPELPAPLESEPETERYRLFEAVVGLMSEISATAPLLLVLDDLQWADRPTLLLLRHLARAPHPGRVLVLGAYRGTEARMGGFADALAELRRDRLVTQIEVPGLDESETAELVRLRTGGQPTASFCSALHEETEGNPFFIEEIVRHLQEAGVQTDHAGARALQRFGLPEGVKDVIARRLTRLDSEAMEWLRAAAVIGRDFDSSLVERVVPLDEDTFLDALDDALASGLVVGAPAGSGRYSFSHALIRETLYDGMSAPRRARTHRRVGEALEGDGDRHLTALALHFTRAAGPEDSEKAIEYATRAGEQATAMLAHEEAVDHYMRALEVLERFNHDGDSRRCELLILLGEAQVRAGERPPAWETFREAAAIASQLGDGERLARAAIGASSRYIQPPGVVDEELIAMLERALAMTDGERTVVRIGLLARLCGALYFSLRRERMTELAAEATEIARELKTPRARALAAAARRRTFWSPTHLEQRLSDSTELLTLAREAGDLELALQGHAWLVVDLLEHGDADAVDVQIEAFTEGAEHLRQPLYLWNAAVWRAMRALLTGRLEAADRLAAEALATGSYGEAVTASQYYATQLLGIRREQSRIAELEAPAKEMVKANPVRAAWRAALATLYWESGRLDQAREEFELLAAHDFADIPVDGDWLIAITLLADCSVALADAGRAAKLYELLAPYRDLNVVIGLAAVCLGSAAQYLGRLSATMGRPDEAAAQFERALAANERLKAPVCLAHTQLDYASLLGAADPRARELVDAAALTASQLELPAVAKRVAALRNP
jgi:DNA-binding SARP family transcriptional activator/tetratricopeptide (TPR) repeat protein